VISVYRISSALFPTNSGEGAAKYGGRWNRIGSEVIYAAQSPSLAALEVLVHYSILPSNHLLTEIRITESVPILQLEVHDLPSGWDSEILIPQTQELGEQWLREKRFPVLSLPSTIIPFERNFVINPAHKAFKEIEFRTIGPVHFDRRLKS
jgi:RES domain-containing protein